MRWRTAHRRRAKRERFERHILQLLKERILEVVKREMERVIAKHYVVLLSVCAVGPAQTRELARSGEIDQITEDFIERATHWPADPAENVG